MERGPTIPTTHRGTNAFGLTTRYGTRGEQDENGIWIVEPHWEDDPIWVATSGHASSSISPGPQHGTLTEIETGYDWTEYTYDGQQLVSGREGLAFRYTP